MNINNKTMILKTILDNEEKIIGFDDIDAFFSFKLNSISENIMNQDALYDFSVELNKAKIIMFYSTIEIKLKQLVHLYSVFVKKTKDNIWKKNFYGLIKKYKKNFSVDFKKLDGFKEVNEIREINNCYKHSEKVSKKLGTINPKRWCKKDKDDDAIKLKVTEDDFNRLIEPAKGFYWKVFKAYRDYLKI